MAMEPALTQFESKYKSKINPVSVNVDETGSPEYGKYSELLKTHSRTIPFSIWIDDKGKVLNSHAGGHVGRPTGGGQ